MHVSYTKLWKTLSNANMNKTTLMAQAHISSRSMAKLGHDEDVSLDVSRKI